MCSLLFLSLTRTSCLAGGYTSDVLQNYWRGGTRSWGSFPSSIENWVDRPLNLTCWRKQSRLLHFKLTGSFVITISFDSLITQTHALTLSDTTWSIFALYPSSPTLDNTFFFHGPLHNFTDAFRPTAASPQ